MTDQQNEDFLARRAAARDALEKLPGNYANDSAGRTVFFDAVYERAEGDAACVPWADLAPKSHLADWLSDHPGQGKRAIDIACGLGDNAEAIAQAGYQVTAFDVVGKAIDWAKTRFVDTTVDYQVADLFHLPEDWQGSFDLVHECFTLQALPQEILNETAKAICDLVAPAGTLLIYTRYRPDHSEVDGPPWPLEERFLDLPAIYGLTKTNETRFDVERPDRTLHHSFAIWQKS